QERRGFFGWFNRVFDRGSNRYQGVVGHMLVRPWRYMIGYGVIVVLVMLGFSKLPVGFLPDEDQGTLFALIQLPPGATEKRTDEVIRQNKQHIMLDEKDAVSGVFTVFAFGF
uniref:efflux RND transporter permease subunit n=1 Tax=Pseudomonas viridiflava TaxID=33069 RepID=UPI001980E4C8